jgi:hypothetical protein
VKTLNTVIAGLTRNLLTCSFQILSLAFGDLRMTVSRIFTQADGSSVHIGGTEGRFIRGQRDWDRGRTWDRGTVRNH